MRTAIAKSPGSSIELEREHGGEPWHGTSARSASSTGIDHQQAAARPLAGAHTIWELVLHITAWKNEVRQRLDGAPAGEPIEGDWPEPPARRAPTRGARRSRRSRKRIAPSSPPSPACRDPHCSSGPTIRGPRERFRRHYFQLVHGILQHDVYHSGQIALLKKAV